MILIMILDRINIDSLGAFREMHFDSLGAFKKISLKNNFKI